MSKGSIKSYKTKVQLIAEELRVRIVDGRLLPRQRLVLRQLAEQFGSSETPVREALTSLASLGFIKLVPHSGAYVTEINAHELIELTELRFILEPVATCQAAERLPKSALVKLYAMLEVMSQLAAENEAVAYGTLNREFHDAIINFCPNKRLLETIRSVRDQAERGRVVYSVLPEHMEESLAQHCQIVDYIARRDIGKLREISVSHGKHVLNAMHRLAESFPRSEPPDTKGRRKRASPEPKTRKRTTSHIRSEEPGAPQRLRSAPSIP